jgi:hypothetical protein
MEKLSHEEMVKRAVRVLNAPGGTVNAKVAFLTSKGCDGLVIMEALNIATSGELVRTALGNPSKPRRARRTKNPFAKIRKALNEP